jgi:ribulose kinase
MAILAVMAILAIRDSARRIVVQREAGWLYNSSMAKSSPPFEVTCPCCGAMLKIDPATKAVIAHTAAVKPKTFADFEAAAKAMREQEGRKESLFRQAVDAEKNKADLLEKKFQEAVKKAKETPDEPHRIRDFDLD